MRVDELVDLLGSPLGRRWLWQNTRKRLYSRHESVCLRRDLTVPFTPPPAKIPLEFRQLRPDDDLALIADEPGLSAEVRQLRTDQRWMLSCDLPAPWVALDPDGVVCLMAWWLTARDNDRIKAVWGDWLPQLKPDEAIIEGIYTAESHRGLGIMAVAATEISARAAGPETKWGLGFILLSNKSSRRGGEKAGWTPYLRREERWVLFRRRVTFTPYEDRGD